MVSIDIAPDDLELLSKFVLRLGGYAEGLFDYHDFGFPKESLKLHISRVTDELRRMRESIRGSALSLRPPGLPEDALWEEADEVWNYGQTLRFAAGATMITQRYQSRMTAENLRRSMIPKVLPHCPAGRRPLDPRAGPADVPEASDDGPLEAEEDRHEPQRAGPRPEVARADLPGAFRGDVLQPDRHVLPLGARDPAGAPGDRERLVLLRPRDHPAEPLRRGPQGPPVGDREPRPHRDARERTRVDAVPRGLQPEPDPAGLRGALRAHRGILPPGPV